MTEDDPSTDPRFLNQGAVQRLARDTTPPGAPRRITIDCTIRENLRNSAGAAHGGVAAAMADAAVGIAIQRHFGGGRRITTVELKINYFLPVTEGRIFARSHLLRIGSTLCVGNVDLTDERGRAIGTAIVTYMFMNGPAVVPSARRPARPSPGK